LLWISYVAFVFVVFFFLAMPVMPVKSVLHSLGRLPKVGTSTTSMTIPARKDDVELQVNFDSDELQSYTLKSEQDLVVGVEPGKAYSNPLIRIEGGEPYTWSPSSKRQRLFNGPLTKLYVTNQGDLPTELTAEYRTDVPLVEV